MSKVKTLYFCQNCGAQSVKWLGKCPTCNEWNTFVEEIVQKETKDSKNLISHNQTSKPALLSDIDEVAQQRIITTDNELNRVLGGGIVPGSLVLIGGEPGIGKSTLMLQLALSFNNLKVLYISGEESGQQIKLRAERLGYNEQKVFVLCETVVQNIFTSVNEIKPDIIIVDSIQTVSTTYIESSVGSVSQIRECANEFQKFSKTSNIPVFLIGHITKEGSLAGPKVLEHMVDTVLQFEGDRNHGYRILRSIKNRFGSTSELGIYEMNVQGLRQVTNPSEVLLSNRDEQFSGITVASTMEGLRPLLIEIQSLVSTAAYGTPQRSSTGFDLRRMSMLLAVLEKRCGFRLGVKDVFLNIAGGIKVDDPAIDLAVVTAILSSSEDIPISSKYCFAAEVGLSGEIRPINRIEQRIAEAEKIGFNKIFISKYNLKGLNTDSYKIKVVPSAKIEEVFSYLFG